MKQLSVNMLYHCTLKDKEKNTNLKKYIDIKIKSVDFNIKFPSVFGLCII